jgi:hypothetical protein
VTVLAAASSANAIEPGVLGFLVVAGMGVALFFLLRSLNKQLRKISPDAPSRQESSRATAANQNGHVGGPDTPSQP